MKLFLVLIIPALVLALPSKSTLNRWYDGDCGRSKYSDAGSPFRINVVGGIEAREYEFPYQVHLQLFGDPWCGGSIINEQWIVTAAHCILFRDDMRAILREHDISSSSGLEQEFELETIIMHPDYPSPGNDIALMKLAGTAEFNEDIQPICSPDPASDYAGATSAASGWGALQWGGGSPDILNWVSMGITTHEECVRANEEVGYLLPVDSEICAGNPPYTERDTCQGDSGGPLAVKEGDQFRLVGLTSHGFECAGGAPGIYARVTSFLDWMDDVMAEN